MPASESLPATTPRACRSSARSSSSEGRWKARRRQAFSGQELFKRRQMEGEAAAGRQQSQRQAGSGSTTVPRCHALAARRRRRRRGRPRRRQQRKPWQHPAGTAWTDQRARAHTRTRGTHTHKHIHSTGLHLNKLLRGPIYRAAFTCATRLVVASQAWGRPRYPSLQCCELKEEILKKNPRHGPLRSSNHCPASDQSFAWRTQKSRGNRVNITSHGVSLLRSQPCHAPCVGAAGHVDHSSPPALGSPFSGCGTRQL